MSKKVLGFAVVGLFSVLFVPTASAQLCTWSCTCQSSCDQVCTTGPDIPDCPECNQSTCGAHGVCTGFCPPTGSCEDPACTSSIYGNSNGNTLNGTSADECIYGYAGNDTLYGHAGEDWLYGGDGADTLYGGSGDDCLYGEAGNDSLNGETGSADSADGGGGTDTCTAETETSCEI